MIDGSGRARTTESKFDARLSPDLTRLSAEVFDVGQARSTFCEKGFDMMVQCLSSRLHPIDRENCALSTLLAGNGKDVERLVLRKLGEIEVGLVNVKGLVIHDHLQFR